MKWTVKFKEKIEESITLNRILKLLGILGIIYLLSLTSHVWMTVIKTIFKITLPFIIGFVIAYVLYPIVRYLDKKGITKKIVVPLIFFLLLICLALLVFTVSPMIYTQMVSFINSLIQAVNKLFEIYKENSMNNTNTLVQEVFKQFNVLLNESKNWLPNLSAILPQIFNSFIGFLTNALFAVIISIYFLLEYEQITSYINRLSEKFNPDLPKLFQLIDQRIGIYLHGLVILMMIKFVEYGLLYYLIGHKDWFVLALLSSISLLVPYFGGTVANLIGILTALSLPTFNIVCLLIGIVLLSNIDAYVIEPFVHMKNSRIRPLWTLFSIFAGGILFGSIGVMISLPVYMIIRVIIEFYREKFEGEAKETL